jgi:hypothetical protein
VNIWTRRCAATTLNDARVLHFVAAQEKSIVKMCLHASSLKIGERKTNLSPQSCVPWQRVPSFLKSRFAKWGTLWLPRCRKTPVGAEYHDHYHTNPS